MLPPLSAKTGREQVQQIEVLFDHFVDQHDERGWDDEPERSRRSRIDDELDLGGLCHR